MFQVLLSLLISLLMIATAHAESDCSPLQFLQQRNRVTLDENLVTNLQILSDHLNEDKTNHTVSAEAVYQNTPFKGSDADAAESRLRNLLKINYNNDQKRTLYTSMLPDSAVQAYVECLKNNKVDASITVSSNVIDNAEPLVTISWHPHYSAPQKGDLAISISGGELKDPASSDMSIVFNKSVTVKIARNIYKPTDLVATIDGQPFRLEFPVKPSVSIVKDTLNGEHVTYTSTDTLAHPTLQPCVEVPKEIDAAIIPNTTQFQYVKDIRVSRSWEDKKDQNINQDRKSCITTLLNTEANRNYADIETMPT